VLASPALLAPRRRRRTLLAQYKALLSRKSLGSVLADLEAIRATDDCVRHFGGGEVLRADQKVQMR
jgi:hypothetical protein